VIPECKVEIVKSTCRPRYIIYENGESKAKTWLNKAHEIYGSELFSMNKFFSNYVCDNNNYPSKDELLVYIYKYYSSRGKATLPIYIHEFAITVLEEYKDIMEKIKPGEFIGRYNASVRIKDRIIIEKM
jgi:hypothetical protein